ncbi:MAG: UDP-N-acetylmuramoyl-tripeptide--D-alanyl-D-alanine ligase [Acutalibacter sp.]|jgi:UDP-N-acetylmuramoyl-tripeptide--D-alanyl-D-alanine ligase|uniref:UDP-N-acetylmuramoyl-tripeptide--D-alanyl-D- alanine ligase n=1 Tax=Acutalibacter sp. TaxID=1918636 RepID=UPI00216FD2FC|nr:UDP-N-acetylmuramoyl-tripeptide--D-alanyl-D-alanine ligase [Acutalibacter sp.]MCI9225296.1 UDP-N-acetylmuramoyl-tripeptide--D-alanyl-D-alanine ligase [Acutalibacter sp.]
MKYTLSEIAAMTGGKILGGDPDTAVTGFFTDSREARPGLMFVPIRGENLDGHSFIAPALEKGAAASFTDRPMEPAGPLLLVEDCRAALQMAAQKHRERFCIPIVGVTGSVGKTTAKELAALAIGAGHNVLKTPGNANSQVGVPITVCAIDGGHTAAVVEMGVSMPGEMERIARVVKPTCGIITTIGTSHIEFMKSRENILSEKAKLADYLTPEAPLFVCGDNDLLASLDGGGRFRVVTFGLGESCQWRAVDIREDGEGQTFTCHAPDGRVQQVRLPVPGGHIACDALAALAAADFLGVPLESAARALCGYTPPSMRQVISDVGGVCLIDDSYNASPDSMRSAIDLLAGRDIPGRRIAVLAGMRELGDYTRDGHLLTGAYARERGIDALIAVGELGGIIAEGFGSGALRAGGNPEAWELLREMLRPGDAVLVKGSRGMKTEEIVNMIRRDLNTEEAL